MIKHTLHNDRQLPIHAIVESPSSPRGVAYIAHGFSGWKDQPYIKSMHEAFYQQGYITVRWDAGERDIRRITASSYYEDLEAVIRWGSAQIWHIEHIFVAGHSLGGLVAAHFATLNQNRVKGLILAASALGPASVETALRSPEFSAWINETISKMHIPRIAVRIMTKKFEKDLQHYDLFLNYKTLTMPVLVIAGAKDTIAPPAEQQRWFDLVPAAHKQLEIVPNLSHDVHPYDLQLTVKGLIENFVAGLEAGEIT